MKKYSHTYAELTKLQNQIRVELNRVRPHFEQVVFERKEKSTKRHFRQTYSQTSISEPPEERSHQETTPSKRYLAKGQMVHQDQNKLRQRRHYDNSYVDKVNMAIPITRKTSAYLNVAKPEKENERYEPHHTSLLGVGKNDKSISKHSKSGRRIFASKYANQFWLIYWVSYQDLTIQPKSHQRRPSSYF